MTRSSSTAPNLPTLAAHDEPLCQRCLDSTGKLCAGHAPHVLPQLAVNRGWLTLMGNATVEQKRRQSPDAKERTVIEKAKRRVERAALRLKARRRNELTSLVQSLHGVTA